MRLIIRIGIVVLVCCSFVSVVSAQQATPPEANKNPRLSPTVRLAAAQTVFVRDSGGASIAYKVLTSDLEGWGRLKVVNAPDKADLIIDVTASGVARGGGVSVSSSTTQTNPAGKPETSTSTTKDLSSGPLRMVVLDARNNAALWSASEQVKSALRQKAQEDAVVAAAERLFKKFHDVVEPPAKD